MWMLGALVIVLTTAATASAQAAPAEDVAETSSPWSAGGEIRLQYERFRNEEWGAEPDDRSGYLLQRYMLHARRALGTRAVVFVEMKSGIELGRAGGPRLPDEDRLDLHQAHLDVSIGRARLRAGRQELSFGSSRLVSFRDLNVRQSFDASRVSIELHSWRIDAFGGWPAQTLAGPLDDATDKRRALWGLYTVAGSGKRAGADVYYLGYRRRGARFDSAAGSERRHSYGIRLWGSAPGGSDSTSRADYNIEIVGQMGSIGAQRIRAWTVASDTGYRVAIRMQPRFGVHADVTSGDLDRSDRTLGTFNAMFPRGAYFGQIASTGPANHIDLNPEVELHPGRRAVVTVGWLMFWRKEIGDGLYSVAGQLLRSGAGASSRFVGHSPAVGATWTVARVMVSAHASAFSAGPFIRETGSRTGIAFIRTSVTYRFGR